MIQFTFNYMCLIASEPADNRSRIAFPSKGHKLEVTRGGTLLASGEYNSRLELVVTEANVEKNLGTPNGGSRVGGRVFSIADVTGSVHAMQDTAALISSKDAQTVLTLHGGTFTPEYPTPGTYADAEWDFGTLNKVLLTDQVTWQIPYDTKYKYYLSVDGARELLSDGDVVLYSNDDDPKGLVSPNENNEVVLSEIGELYALLATTPAKTPIPTTPYVGPPPPPVPPPVAAPPSGPPAPPTPDAPLCPVGETP